MKLNFEKFGHKKIALAVSGGADSMALLHLAIHESHDITVLHVNHNLRDVAISEENYVREFCKSHNIQCVVFNWNGAACDSNIESCARAARYKLMTDWCHENGVGAIMTAHQRDDQIETFLMNLGRGSGLHGLAAMRPETVRDGIKIIRPLLDISRTDLEQYCNDNNVKYFHDEMNDDEKYTRVRIRKNRHLLNEKLGISDARIMLAIQNLNRARDTVEYFVDELVRKYQIVNRKLIIPADMLFSQPVDIQFRFIATILQRIGGAEYSPRLGDIERLIKKLHSDTVTTLSHCTVRKLGDKILVVPEGAPISFKEKRKNEKNIKNQTPACK